jgi:DNA polymerase-3 subunit delta'
MRYDDVIGLKKSKQELRQMIRMDRMPHALLFLGPNGCGKLALAIALARELLCGSPRGGWSLRKMPQLYKSG